MRIILREKEHQKHKIRAGFNRKKAQRIIKMVERKNPERRLIE